MQQNRPIVEKGDKVVYHTKSGVCDAYVLDILDNGVLKLRVVVDGKSYLVISSWNNAGSLYSWNIESDVINPSTEPVFVRKKTQINKPNTRMQLIEIARELAETIARSRKEKCVTSTDVWTQLRKDKVNLEGHDPRWMGAVFDKTKWINVGYMSTGSHKRPVTVWRLRG